MHMNLASLFEGSHNLPIIPKVVQELIATFNDDNFNMEDIAQKISMDPVLTAKVLRLANCAHYGTNRTVASAADAAVILGFSTLRTLVLASGITGAVQTPEGFDRKAFWLNSFGVAAIAKWLAPYSNQDKETAFTCGMLYSIGEMLIQLIAPAESKKIKAAANAGGKLYEIEKAILGFCYADVGAELAERWKFPDDITQGIKFHLTPKKAGENDKLAGIINIAIYIYKCQKEKLSDEETLNEFPNDVAKLIGMDTEKALYDLFKLHGIESGMDSLLSDL
jgi:HD-like signal output (HDOD) protein